VREQRRKLYRLTAQEMALQVLGVQVRLGAVRARKLAIGILDGNDGVLRSRGAGSGSSRTAGSAGQDATATLRSNDVSRLLSVLHDTVGLHQRARTVGRRDAGLAHETARRHGTQDRRTATTSGSGSNRLGVRGGGSRLRHHGRRGAILLRVRVRVLGHARVHAAATARLRGLRIAGRQVVGRVWRVGRTRARGMRVASVEGLHGAGGGRLQRRKSLGKGRTRLAVMRRKRGRRRITVCSRVSVYTIGGIRRTVHALARLTRREGFFK
jgi:hypothetical protein